MKRNLKYLMIPMIVALVGGVVTACSKTDWPDMPDDFPGGNLPGGGVDDSDVPDFEIAPWDGEKADDASSDNVDTTNDDIYHEANSFTEKVTVIYDGSTARVILDENSKIKYFTDGAYVTIDMLTNSVKGVEMVVSGKSDDGQLKIYGDKKFKLTLNGLELTSAKGPAINDQCKKRVFVHLADGTTNRLTDCKKYSDEPYYLTPTGADDEDRKGCFFSEGNMIFSGTGVLEVAGKYKHAIVTDGYLWMRPGVTIVVTEAAKNAVHVKGDATDDIGFHMAGGLLYTNVASTAGKGIKTDLHAVIEGGKLLLTQSGDATYDESENDTSSAAGIKTDGNVIITGGDHNIKSSGIAGKGINADGSIIISGGCTTVTTTGDSYYKSASITSSPKGVKAEGDINITGGTLNIAVTGSGGSYGSPEGLESKSTLTIDGGNIYSYATDDAINAITGITINGGNIYAHSTTNDGIDSNGFFHVNGGLVIANGASGPEESFDCDNTSKFLINGGTLIGTGGTFMQTPSSSSKQRVVLYRGLTVSKDDKFAVVDADGNSLIAYQTPRALNSMVLFYSSPDIKAGSTYTISKSGTLSDYASEWNGCYIGGKWSGGSQLGSFTSNSVVTTVGSGMGGGFPGGGFPGGHR
ncbi:MAG: carbohydrate-binding domain-containing protein [Muribaculaceae bacterium]|nr:carbohydrate-binding domain-containing protein [Muribaculaceae bacterium]